ncbi:MAG: phenylalanine--tRNA ligase subunit beta [Clostridia bacterium]|nr:phenylalanine--tRNA ligase subunit beta [Clostridia bacterium]
MILSMKWLSDFTDMSDVSIKEYCDKLTLTGSKVEGYETLGEDISGVVVGRILSVTPHSNSDHLVICSVDVGREAPLQIVTGASNVFEGAVVPVATDGSHLPGGIKIKKGKLRGEVSEGMLCSIGELNLTTHDMPGAVEDGILILNHVGLGDTPVGTDIHDALELSDTAVEFEITSNRPDCLSMIGLARESAVSFGKEMKLPKLSFGEDAGDGDDIANYIGVEVANTEKCFRYSAKVVKNVKIAPSPLWLRMRLRAAGVRPINNIVDITNYVMLEYGQPMHAFDYKCLDGKKIVVRSAAEGEEYVTLDNIKHNLNGDMLVIADEKKPVALAGVMGGANSGIADDTVTVVFESAMFHPGSVRRTAKALGMRTESSSRFEKGLDSENTIPALMRACELVRLLGAGDVVDGLIDVYPEKKAPVVLPLEADKINAFLGTAIPQEKMEEILASLGFTVNADGTVTSPTWRIDIESMNDLAEEVIRIYGYNDIESTVDSVFGTGMRTPAQAFDVKVRDMLLGMGIDEVQTFSFISPKFYDKIRMAKDDVRRNSVVITNPLGEDTSVMRTTVVPSMMNVLSANASVKNRDVYLFEAGNVYLPSEVAGQLPDERKKITVGFYKNGAKGADGFYELKGIVDAIIDIAAIADTKYISCSDENAFHPGRCAKVLVNGRELGVLGQIHPLVAEEYNIAEQVYVCELDFATLFEERRLMMDYKPVPKFPAVERDFSFVCEEALEVGTIAEVIKNAGGKLLESVELFDIYRGAQIGENMKSVSFAVMLRDREKTLTVEEADKVAAKILKALEEKLGITLRA